MEYIFLVVSQFIYRSTITPSTLPKQKKNAHHLLNCHCCSPVPCSIPNDLFCSEFRRSCLEGLEYINAVRIQYSALKLIWDVAVAEGLKESFATMPTCNYPKLHGQKVKGSLECILATMLFTGECSVLIFLTIKKNNTARTSFFQMSWWREGRLLPVGHQVLVLKNYIL